ncbi:hypothetical protein GCM10009092_30240 [Bowmanella denitrificans]|uniref:Tail specific protease domain-containing protein n=1 Tax=Bowmanella denitrificans TaxID=366582 RepID=A0ABN0XGS8_9ALTE
MNWRTASIEGIWEAPAYGRLMHIQPQQVCFYDVVGNHLLTRPDLQLSRLDWEQQHWQQDGLGRLRRIDDFLGVNYRYEIYNRATNQQAWQKLRILPGREQAGYLFQGGLELRLFWQSFARYYIAFERRGVTWPELPQHLADIQHPAQLLEQCAQLIAPVRDAHIQLCLDDYPDRDFVARPTIWDSFLQQAQQAGIKAHEAQWDHVFAQTDTLLKIKLSYAPEGQICQAGNGNLHWFISKENIGVVIIDAMEDFSGEELDDESAQIRADMQALDTALQQIVSDLQHCRGIVLDLRSNPGGYDQHSQLIAKRFLASPTSVYKKQAGLGALQTETECYQLTPASGLTLPRMPLLVLQSASTMSAAELLILMLKARGNVILAGETSQGVLSDVLEKRLPCGLEYGISNERYLSMQDEWFEATGIDVEQRIDYAQPAHLRAGVDPGLEQAIALFQHG